MKKNEGNMDRVIRVIVALGIVGLYLANVVSGVLGIALLVVAAVLIVTSLTGYCLLYTLLGISTFDGEAEEKK